LDLLGSFSSKAGPWEGLGPLSLWSGMWSPNCLRPCLTHSWLPVAFPVLLKWQIRMLVGGAVEKELPSRYSHVLANRMPFPRMRCTFHLSQCTKAGLLKRLKLCSPSCLALQVVSCASTLPGLSFLDCLYIAVRLEKTLARG
jgi:hypothetical protein